MTPPPHSTEPRRQRRRRRPLPPRTTSSSVSPSPPPTLPRSRSSGDFNGWAIDEATLADADGDGVWTAAVPMQPGRYAYMFVIDGTKWVLDPEAKAIVPDGFGGTNGILRL